MSASFITVRALRNGGGINVGYGTTATSSAALPTGTSVVRLVSTTDCYIEMGGGATASAGTGAFLPASVPEYFTCAESVQISVAAAVNPGTLNIKPCSG